MTATAHALVGGAIAASISNPYIGLPLAAISHPVLDMIPHWDLGWGWRKKSKVLLFFQASADLVFGFALAYLLFGRNMDFWYFSGAILLAEIWDIMQSPYWLLNWKFPPFSYFYNIQHAMQGKAKLPWGILTQAGTVAALVILLKIVH